MGVQEALSEATARLASHSLAGIIPAHQNVVFLEHNSSVGHALQVLAKRHILSAPLVILPGLEDMEGADADGAAAPPQLIGWVTVESILRAFLQQMEEKHGKLPRNMLLLMTQLEKEGPAFAEKALITVAGSEDRGLMFQVNSDVPLLEAIRESFVPTGKAAAHRLAVFDASGAITAVVSQLDVIRYLREHLELLGALADVTVAELGWAAPGARPLVAVEASLPALLAYERMARAGVSGAPVVADSEAAVGSGGGNGSGAMIANLSMSDLRNIQTQHLGILALPVGEFLALLHNTSYLGYSQRTSTQAAHPFFASGPPTALPPGGPRVSAPGSPPLGGGPGPGARRTSAAGGAAPMDTGAGGGEGGEEEAESVIRMLTCNGASTLREVLAIMVDNRVHRVYVAAAGQPAGGPLVVPVGVITPTDILRLLAGTKGPAPKHP
ncbi:hypothetical protein HYH02_002183 [Chlamydomonas schloesseri]|uniref:CBS domain-containing protein n=1 Tax=Chlamydomonas schloesseri TaxID=2026947 RepID=A0A835WSW0_9CHLO|nr:hypothetical protein HYH02_002183 [Chlamydomonas schloesseri]|eukprot:KAG2452837.1 hypothetical protein HYH02_002183 [Chlamydomonas schloesseri]